MLQANRKSARTNFTWLYFQTLDSLLFPYLNPNILYSVHLIDLFSSVLVQTLDSFWKHVTTKSLISLCWHHILRSCLYEKNHPTKVRRLTWLGSQQNGVFHFVKTNRLYENGFIPPRRDLTSTQVRSHLSGKIFLHVNSFCRAVPPRQDCSFSLDSIRFYNY